MNDEPSKRICPAHGAGLLLCGTVARLEPLYAVGTEDRPDALQTGGPNPSRVTAALSTFIDAMFPGKITEAPVAADGLNLFLYRRLSEGWQTLLPEIEKALPFRWIGEAARAEGAPEAADVAQEARRVLSAFLERLPDVRARLVEDVRAAYEGDPAALTFAEVQLAYPGLLAIASHRLAHELYRQHVPIIPRIMSEWTHARTGVDINPGASIGHGFFIDHATGVVIGETAVIGHRVKVYQGVTLGARSFPLDEHGRPVKHIKRHPTVEDDVVIYANATILGGETVIGRGSVIGGNVFLMESVPPNSLVTTKHAELHIRPGKT